MCIQFFKACVRRNAIPKLDPQNSINVSLARPVNFSSDRAISRSLTLTEFEVVGIELELLVESFDVRLAERRGAAENAMNMLQVVSLHLGRSR